MKFVEPKTFLVGVTQVDSVGLREYLRETNNQEFLVDFQKALDDGISSGEALCSFYAKLCYKSLTLGANKNVTKIRGIKANLESIIETGHGSVLEHCTLNFVTTDCSRVFTHELVRHRVGTAFSQTSGRYVALDKIDFVFDPILEPVRTEIKLLMEEVETKARMMREKLITPGMTFAQKKKLTSAIRRIAPNGQSNEIGWSVNLRSLRHTIQMRTSRHAEWEIRVIFNQVVDIITDRWPHILHGAEVEVINGMNEYTKLKV
jgi:thymidylate synthase (FAD)